jgi:uroporphyrinogen III methyltransferase / synthase
MAPPGAVRVDVGKASGHAPTSQARINQLLIDHGRRHDIVIRLKGGDPYVFGRGGEEAEALIAAGVRFEVVPGISAAIAAPSAAGIPVTMRDHAAAFTVVTGHDGTRDSGVDWEAHAATGATLVIMMGARTIGEIAKRLIVGGRHPDTPATAIRWATTDRQQTVRSTLAEIGHCAIEPPCTIVVGDVAGLDLRDPHRPR